MQEIFVLIILLCVFYVILKVLAIVGEFAIKVLIGGLVIYGIYRGIRNLLQKRNEKRVVIRIKKGFVG
jgi:1,4-dihydroxy-2-naphthoate octaprenyltransferase